LLSEILRIEHLKKYFVKKSIFKSRSSIVKATDDVSFSLQGGEVFVLAGESGSGKSTIAKLILKSIEADSGKIFFEGNEIGNDHKSLEKIRMNCQMIHQDPYDSINPRMKISDIISEPLEIHNIGDSVARKKRVLEVLREVKLEPVEDIVKKYPHMLSGGQRQRVAIGRAIVRQPSIFLLDEPLSNLDAQLRTATRMELKALQRQLEITTVYVTHDQVEAMSLGNRIALLSDGDIVQVGSPEELYNKPANAFVAKFIGSPPMNLLKVDLFKENDSCWISIGRQKIKVDGFNTPRRLAPKRYLLGIRPEDIAVHDRSEQHDLKCQLLSVEPLGRELLLQVGLENQDLTILTTDIRYAKAKAGINLNLLLDLTRMHFFEQDDEQKVVFSPHSNWTRKTE